MTSLQHIAFGTYFDFIEDACRLTTADLLMLTKLKSLKVLELHSTVSLQHRRVVEAAHCRLQDDSNVFSPLEVGGTYNDQKCCITV